MPNPREIDRRSFLKGSAAVCALIATAPRALLVDAGAIGLEFDDVLLRVSTTLPEKNGLWQFIELDVAILEEDHHAVRNALFAYTEARYGL